VIRCGMCPWSSPVCTQAMSLPTQPSETAELARQATELHLQGRLAEAIECYRQLLRATPEHPRLHYNLGVAPYQLGNHPAAITAYNDALRLRPAYPEAWCNLGIAQTCGSLDAAIECYREALRLQPGSADIHSNLGNALQLRREKKCGRSPVMARP
jgi:Flp pilus assembly protein TadD